MGELLALLSSVCFATSNVTVARGARGADDDNGAFLSLLLTGLVAAVAFAAHVVASGMGSVTPKAVAWFAAAGLFSSFIGRVFLFASVQHLGAVRASAVKRLNPFFGVLVGVLALGDPLTSGMLAGGALIALSFAILVHASLARAPRGDPDAARPWWRVLANLGYVYGPVSALGYAFGAACRKLGLVESGDPYFGTLVGALVGIALFLATAAWRPAYRRSVVAACRRPNPWLLAGGISASFGQLLYFLALDVASVSRVALLSSFEVFITMFLSVVVVRARERVARPEAIAAAMGVGGTVLLVAL